MHKMHIMQAYDGQLYHVWQTIVAPQMGVIQTPYTRDAVAHKTYTTKREADRDTKNRLSAGQAARRAPEPLPGM